MLKPLGYVAVGVSVAASIFQLIGLVAPNWYYRSFTLSSVDFTHNFGLWKYCIDPSTTSSCTDITDYVDTSEYTFSGVIID